MIEAQVEIHAEEAAFLWLLRDKATSSPAYTRADMAFLDERVEAHLDGLRVAGDRGFEICKSCLPADDAGEAFALSTLAIECERWPELAHVLDASEQDTTLQRGIVSALGWAPWSKAQPAVDAMVSRDVPPALKVLGLGGAVAHRQHLPDALDAAITSSHDGFRARGLRACGELGATRLLPELEAASSSTDITQRFWAAWSLVLLGKTAHAATLWDIAFSDSALGAGAADLAARVSTPIDTRRHIDTLRNRGNTAHAMTAAAASGDAFHLAWLLDLCSAPETARRAALAIVTITGIDLQEQQAEARPPAPPPDDDEPLPADPDADLLWPDPDTLRRLCAAMKLAEGQTFMLGKPIGIPWLEQVVTGASQHHRRSAAIELALATPGRPLIETRGPAFR